MESRNLEKCKKCDGNGQGNELICSRCNGKGMVKWTQNILKRNHKIFQYYVDTSTSYRAHFPFDSGLGNNSGYIYQSGGTNSVYYSRIDRDLYPFDKS